MQVMAKSAKSANVKRKPARPLGQFPVQVQLRLSQQQVTALDAYCLAQMPSPTRSEAIRRILASVLGDYDRAETINEKISSAKRRIARNPPDAERSPSSGMSTLRRGLAENDLRTLREKKRRTRRATRDTE